MLINIPYLYNGDIFMRLEAAHTIEEFEQDVNISYMYLKIGKLQITVNIPFIMLKQRQEFISIYDDNWCPRLLNRDKRLHPKMLYLFLHNKYKGLLHICH